MRFSEPVRRPQARRSPAPPGVPGLLLVLLLVAVPAEAWDLRGDAPAEDFEAFHHRFASAAWLTPRHGAHPLGWTGFEVWADTSVDPGFGDEPFARTMIDGDLPADALAFLRVGARKGLPGGFDLGASWGRSVGGDVELLSGELGWALLDGGPLAPAVGLRLSGTRTLDAGAYELEQVGLEVLASKGFPVLTLFGGAGVVRSDGELSGPASPRDLSESPRLREDVTQEVFFAGVVLRLLGPDLTVELSEGESLQGAVRLSFGF